MDLGDGVIRKLYAVLLTPDIVNEAREFQAAYALKDPKFANWAKLIDRQQEKWELADFVMPAEKRCARKSGSK